MTGPPRKRLQIVQIDRRPWAGLAAALTGDADRDRQVILDFCSQHRVSLRTARSRLKPYAAQTAPTKRSPGLRSGRANLKRGA